MAAKMPVSPDIEGIFGRACQDCHSNQTVWHWYSRVAPVSWFLVHHVNQGRGELNVLNGDDTRPGEMTGSSTSYATR